MLNGEKEGQEKEQGSMKWGEINEINEAKPVVFEGKSPYSAL